MAKKSNIVSLRKRTLKNGQTSLFIDYYVGGVRKQEFLGLYLKPGTDRATKESNRKTLLLAETVRAKKVVELQEARAGITKEDARPRNLLYYYDKIAALKSGRTRSVWDALRNKLMQYLEGGDVMIDDVDGDWINALSAHLSTQNYRTVGGSLSASSVSLYMSKMRAVFNYVCREGILPKNPFASVKTPTVRNTERCYLTQEEVSKMVAVKDNVPEFAWRPFLFSCLTGLRWSDVSSLRWDEVADGDCGARLVFTQTKTRGLMYLDITDEARALMGDRGERELVFRTASLAHTNHELRVWAAAAGVAKTISFHVARHTFATLALTADVDLYTVSKLLGHSNINTTQVYAKIIDKKRKEAMDKLPKFGLLGPKN